jgi:hypothetical protein
MLCVICKRKTDRLYKHHVVPKVKGGAKKGIVYCCHTCAKQVHMLFSENELAGMTIDELLHTDEMLKYIDWIQKRKGQYKVRKSNRLRRE